MSLAQRRVGLWPWGAGLLIVALSLGLIAVGRVVFVGATYFDSATTDAGFAADVLDPASNLAGSFLGLSNEVNLTWTATPDTYATGYRVMRSIGSNPFTEIATVTPYTNTAYADDVGGTLAGSYRYYVVAYHGAWNSVASNTVTCTKVLFALVCA